MSKFDYKPKLYDISRPLSEQTPVYPGDPPMQREYLADHSKGDDYMLTLCHINSHLGTHIDFPRHFFADGKNATQYTIEEFCGMAQILTLPPVAEITKEILQKLPLHQKFLLLHTSHPQTVLCADAAQYLVSCGIHMLGIDRESPEAEDGDFPVHRILLDNGIWILENIDLQSVSDGVYRLYCFPVAVQDGDAGWVRPVLEG